jgi:CheY-like chemotaxis protein
MRSPFRFKTQSKIVLCIDDNQDVLECEKAFLEGFGYTVLAAGMLTHREVVSYLAIVGEGR